MSKSTTIICGVLLAQVGLWGGAYLNHQFTFQDWQSFPVFITSGSVFLVGVFLTAWGISK